MPEDIFAGVREGSLVELIDHTHLTAVGYVIRVDEQKIYLSVNNPLNGVMPAQDRDSTFYRNWILEKMKLDTVPYDREGIMKVHVLRAPQTPEDRRSYERARQLDERRAAHGVYS